MIVRWLRGCGHPTVRKRVPKGREAGTTSCAEMMGANRGRAMGVGQQTRLNYPAGDELVLVCSL